MKPLEILMVGGGGILLAVIWWTMATRAARARAAKQNKEAIARYLRRLDREERDR